MRRHRPAGFKPSPPSPAAVAGALALSACATTGTDTPLRLRRRGRPRPPSASRWPRAWTTPPIPIPLPRLHRGLPRENMAIVNGTVLDGAGRKARGTAWSSSPTARSPPSATPRPPSRPATAPSTRAAASSPSASSTSTGTRASIGRPACRGMSDGNEATRPEHRPGLGRTLPAGPRTPRFNLARAGGVHHPADPSRLGQPVRRPRRHRSATCPATHRPGHEDARRALRPEDGLRREPLAGLRRRAPGRPPPAWATWPAIAPPGSTARRLQAPVGQQRAKATRRGQGRSPQPATCRTRPWSACWTARSWCENHCYRADEMAQMIDLSKEFGYKITAFHHAIEACTRSPALLAREDICVATWTGWWGSKLESPGRGRGQCAAGRRRAANSCAVIQVRRPRPDPAPEPRRPPTPWPPAARRPDHPREPTPSAGSPPTRPRLHGHPDRDRLAGSRQARPTW